MAHNYEAPSENTGEKIENEGYVTSEKGDVKTENEWDIEKKRREEDPNWYREQE